MRYVLAAAAKDIRRRLRDPAAFAIWIGVPLLLGSLLSFMNSGSDSPPRATVLVVDEDATAASGLLAAALGRVPILDLDPVALDEGRRRIDSGDATALLVVPAGFQQAVLGGSAVKLTLVTNPAERILPAGGHRAKRIADEARGLREREAVRTDADDHRQRELLAPRCGQRHR